MDEIQLVESSRKGDLGAFNQLVEAYQSQVYNLCFRMLADPQLAEDATQETFLAAYRGLGGFRGGHFKAWLLRIAANACYDQLRSRKRRPSFSLESLPAQGEWLPSDPGEGPEESALRHELDREIAKGLAELPPDQRLVVILSDIQGFSYEEIVQITRASLGTVKSRLSRGRGHLRDYLLKQRELLPAQFRLKQ